MHPVLKKLVSRIISGGQTGADRSALDWAIRNDVPHGGWCPRGRKAEDGVLPAKYELRETESTDHRQRTRQNVIDSDGTLVVNLGTLEGGTLKTVQLAKRLGKPHLVLQLDSGVGDEGVRQFLDWLQRESIATLNVAGPRESKRPGIYSLVNELLEWAAKATYYQQPEEKIEMGAAVSMNSAAVAGRPDGRRNRGGISLPFLVAALIAGHAMSSMALLVLPAVAPAVAREYGVDASLIGYQISLVSVGMLASLAMLGNLSRKLGGARTNQIGHGMVGTGMLLMLVPSAIFLIAGSLVVGAGYGFLTPSASYLLMRFTPDVRRNFVFSVHQAAIPLGGILAAIGAPWIAVTVGWRWSVALNALLLFAVVVLMQRGRAGWDDDRDPAHPAVSPSPFTGVAGIWRIRGLRLASVAGGCLCWVQFCVSSFTVVACVEMLGMSLVAAGTVLLAVQLGSVAGRLLAGAIADAVGNANRVLAGIAGLTAATCIASAWLAPAWPLPLVYALFALHGVTSGGWAGILFVEVGRLAPPGQVSMTFSGSLVYINLGKFIGTIVFANVYAFSRSYGFAFASVAVPALIALCCLVAANCSGRQDAAKDRFLRTPAP